ncbi:MAG TPA: type II toxin-antitoxin system HicA family toxin [Candidatus Kapabacteria bacterium]|jgi:predicted RNA binding protein YcfA (HicA-like mRNA interferase family)
MNPHKVLESILRGTSDYNIRFNELTGILQSMGFSERIRGSHHLYSKIGIRELIDLQPENGMAKAYQVRQVRKIILQYELGESL